MATARSMFSTKSPFFAWTSMPLAEKTFPFSTPISDYKNFDGYNLPASGEVIWHYPDGDFVYGKFNFKSIGYNVKK